MNDPLRQDRLMLYARMVKNMPASGDRPYPGLFTRPSVLAAAEEAAGAVPVIAMNLACREMMEGKVSEDIEGLSIIARDCGFRDSGTFIEFFLRATGWHPLEWYRRFSSVPNT